MSSEFSGLKSIPGYKNVLDVEDIPKLWEWHKNIDYHLAEDIKFRTIKPPVPPFPKSEVYFQFCDAMEYGHDWECALAAFKELFNLDAEDNITGASMVRSSGKFETVLSDGFGVDIAMRFPAIRPEDWLTKYDRIAPWVDDVLRDVGPRPEDAPPFEWSPYILAVEVLTGTLEQGDNNFYYMENLVQEAVKHNFQRMTPIESFS